MANNYYKFVDDPYNACHTGLATHPRYLKCDTCKNNTWCDYGTLKLAQKNAELLQLDNDNFIKNAIDNGLLNKNDYCLVNGHYVFNTDNYIRQLKSQLERQKSNVKAQRNAELQQNLKNNCTLFGKIWTYVKNRFQLFNDIMRLENDFNDRLKTFS